MTPPLEGSPVQQVESENEGSWINTELLQQVLEEGATILHVCVQRATGKGDNYLSVLYRTRVEYRVPGSEDVHIKNLMVKGLPPGEYIQKYIEEMNVFRRETSIYSEVLPNLYAFADSRLGNDSFKRFSAVFHKTDRPDTLILDDLKADGFVMASRKDRLDFTHAKLIVQDMARLHAVSLAYNENNPGFILQYEDSMFSERHRERLEQFLVPMLKGVTRVVKKWKGMGKIARKLEQLQDTYVEKLIEICKPADEFTHVLLHGDCWVNNILFKYSETGEPVDLRFVDYQLTRKSSPAIELHYFIFSSIRKLDRVRYFDDLLHEYCDELTHCAKQLGYTEAVFTFEDLRQEMERTMFFGFFSAMVTMAVVLADPDDAPDFSDIEGGKIDGGDIEVFDKVYESPEFREAFEDLLPYFDKFGVLG